MSEFLIILMMTFAIFGISVLGLALGLILRGKVLRGGCGTAMRDKDGNEIGCEHCTRKETNLCEDEDEMGLTDVALMGTFGKYDRKRG